VQFRPGLRRGDLKVIALLAAPRHPPSVPCRGASRESALRLHHGRNGTIYVGVTASLERRAFQHRDGTGSAFAARYRCTMLVWYERYERMEEAIAREKQIKAGSRAKKLALIEAMNPDWRDLYASLAQ
jgi:predicted GIY-YIG superfamily endonuclease